MVAEKRNTPEGPRQMIDRGDWGQQGRDLDYYIRKMDELIDDQDKVFNTQCLDRISQPDRSKEILEQFGVHCE